MSDDAALHPGSPGYRQLGLIDNPFVHQSDDPHADPVGVRLITHAAAMRLVAAIDRAVSTGRSVPIMVLKSPKIPTYYPLAASARVLSTLSNNDDIGVMAVSIPLEAVRIGRIRATLGPVAEHLCGKTVDRTIAAFARVALSDPDRSLEEAAQLDPDLVSQALSALDEDEVAAVASWFGERLGERQGETVDHLMRVAVARQARLEAEPEEGGESGEVDTTDPMADAFLQSVDEEQRALEGAEEEESGEAQRMPEDIVADYLIAHAKAHISPVVGRGLRAYKASGSYAMAQELKITKAPKKTLAALLRLACHRFRKVVLVYDRLDAWPFMPLDLKPRLLSMFSELRWVTERDGLMVLVSAPDVAPEVEEQFAAAERIMWDMNGLEAVEPPDAAVDPELVREWIESCSLDGPARGLDEAMLGSLVEAADDSLVRFSPIAAAAVDDAASRGVDMVDEAAIEVAVGGAVDRGGS